MTRCVVLLVGSLILVPCGEERFAENKLNVPTAKPVLPDDPFAVDPVVEPAAKPADVSVVKPAGKPAEDDPFAADNEKKAAGCGGAQDPTLRISFRLIRPAKGRLTAPQRQNPRHARHSRGLRRDRPYRPAGPPVSEEAILKALDEPATFDFVETPLRDVAEQIEKKFHIPVQLDKSGLDDAGCNDMRRSPGTSSTSLCGRPWI